MTGLTVGEHIAVVQRAQAIAATDHGALVQAQRELADAQAELKRLQRRARRRAPATSGGGATGNGDGRDGDTAPITYRHLRVGRCVGPGTGGAVGGFGLRRPPSSSVVVAMPLRLGAVDQRDMMSRWVVVAS